MIDSPHGVTPELVADLASSEPVIVDNVAAAGRSGSHKLIALGSDGRFWTIVLLFRHGDLWRPITGWPSTNAEIRPIRRLSEAAKKPGDPAVDALDEKDLARYFEEHKDDAPIWESKGRKIRARRGPSTIFQMRIAPEELEEIARAAAGNVSEFVRSAALDKARSRKLPANGQIQPPTVLVLGKAMESALDVVAKAYEDAGRPHGASVEGMRRWLDESMRESKPTGARRSKEPGPTPAGG